MSTTVDPKRKTLFCSRKYIGDVKQDEAHVPDLLEAIMRPPDPAKDELRQKLFKIDQFDSKITNFKVSTFWIPEFRFFPAGGQCQPSHQ